MPKTRRVKQSLSDVMVRDIAYGMTEALQYRDSSPKDLRTARAALRKLVDDDAFWTQLGDYAALMMKATAIKQAIQGPARRHLVRRRNP